MKRFIWGLAAGLYLIGCQENNDVKSDFTGNETTYALQQASDYDIHGTVTFREKLDGSALIVVALSGTEGDVEHPVHLHMGDITTPDADVAALLSPVQGTTGKSETTLTKLSDESSVTYNQLLDLNACIKIHLSATGASRDIILAGGNIGVASLQDVSSGRSGGFGLCKSE